MGRSGTIVAPVLWMVAVLSACDERAPEQASSRPPIAPSSVADQRDAAPAPPSPPALRASDAEPPPARLGEAPAPREPPPATFGVPPFTRGPVVRLPAVEITERLVGDRRVPSVAIPDAESRAKLDQLLERDSHPPGRCRVLLTTETLVSLHCVRSYVEPNAPSGVDRDHQDHHYRVGRGGDVEPVELFSLLLEGVDEWDLRKRLLYRTEASQQRLVLAQNGLVMTPIEGIREGSEEERPARIGYRALAPFVRVGTVLGDLLVAQGLQVAEAGTHMPSMPGPCPAFWGDEVERLLGDWWRLPAADRAQAKLITPGGEHPAALIFVPGTSRSALSAVADVGDALFREPYASIVLARARAPLVLRERPGPRTEIATTLPEGSIVAVADGMVGEMDSRIGRGGWALVSAGVSDYGWTPGADLSPLAAGECVPTAAGTHDVLGMADLTSAGASVPVAFVLGQGTLAIYARTGCALQAALLRIRDGDLIEELLFTRTAKAGGDSLVVVVARANERTVSVYRPGSDEPVYRRAIGDAEVSVSVTRGRNEYYPLRIGRGTGATWAAWNGASLVDASSP